MELSTRNITEYLNQGEVFREIFPRPSALRITLQWGGLHVHYVYDLSS